MDLYDRLIDNLDKHCVRHLPRHSFYDVYHYSLFPPGKLFRPILAYKMFADIQSTAQATEQIECANSSLSLLCSALEVHHTYTLIHDDLPCMDDDDYRRGRESTHKKFGQWKALLAGDGLLNLSYQLLSGVEHSNSQQILKIATWCLGPKGLIQGQALDLDILNNKTFADILLIHKLKTARLIQLSLLGGQALALSRPLTLAELKSTLRYGLALGISFQLLDDLIDLFEDEQDHEQDINPWIHHFQETQAKTIECLGQLGQLSASMQLEHTSHYISQFIQKSLQKFESVCPQEHLDKFSKVRSALQSFN